MFALEENGKDPSKDEIALVVSSLWVGFLTRYVEICVCVIHI